MHRLALFLVSICFASQLLAAPAKDPAVTKVDVEAFDKARQEKDAVVIDVRSPDEFAAGRVPGAINIPVTGKGSDQFDAKMAEAVKGKKPLVYCRSGTRSEIACQKLSAMKVGPIVEFPGGWVAWQQAGKPFEKGPAK